MRSRIWGAHEAEAVAFQESFSAYFGSRFGDLVSDNDTPDTLKILQEANKLLSSAHAMALLSPSSPHIFAAIGDLAQKLASLPDFNDPLALQLKINPRHPELTDNYSNSVLALIQEIHVLFISPPASLGAGLGLNIPIDLMSPEQVISELTRIQKELSQINDNFLAFTQDQKFVLSTCVLPTGKVNLSALFKDARKEFVTENFGPEPKCATQN